MSYTVCKITNLTNEVKQLYAFEFQPHETYIIPDSERDGWANDDNVVVAIASFQFAIEDAVGVIEGVSDQIDYLKELQQRNVNIVGTETFFPSKDIDFPERTGHNVFHKGYEFIADPAAPNGITEHEASYNQWMKIQGVVFRIGDTAFEGDEASEGDYLEIEMVDVLGITGYPAGTVLGTFAETIPVWKGRHFSRICEDAKTIPPMIVLRFRYVARGTEKVRIKIEHVLRTMIQP